MLNLYNGSESNRKRPEIDGHWLLCYLSCKIWTKLRVLLLFSRYQGYPRVLNYYECNSRVKKRMFFLQFHIIGLFKQNIFITCLTQNDVDLTYVKHFWYNTEMPRFMHYRTNYSNMRWLFFLWLNNVFF